MSNHNVPPRSVLLNTALLNDISPLLVPLQPTLTTYFTLTHVQFDIQRTVHRDIFL